MGVASSTSKNCLVLKGKERTHAAKILWKQKNLSPFLLQKKIWERTLLWPFLHIQWMHTWHTCKETSQTWCYATACSRLAPKMQGVTFSVEIVQKGKEIACSERQKRPVWAFKSDKAGTTSSYSQTPGAARNSLKEMAQLQWPWKAAGLGARTGWCPHTCKLTHFHRLKKADNCYHVCS